MAFGVALRTWAGITHLPTDHLGSTSIASNASGALVARQTYYPYGTPRTSAGTLPTDYTGQRVDASAGLMYYHARYYDAALGRFISADTLVADWYNPQLLNRFAYVRNNPVNLTDPSGHCDPDYCRWRPDGNGGWVVEPKEPKLPGPITSFIRELPGTAEDWSHIATGLDAFAWLGDLYAAGVVTYGGIAGAGITSPAILGGAPEVPVVTGLAGTAIAELFVQPILRISNSVATGATVATVISSTKSGQTVIEEGMVGLDVRNSVFTTTVGWMIPEAYTSLVIQTVSVTNDLGWTSFPLGVFFRGSLIPGAIAGMIFLGILIVVGFLDRGYTWTLQGILGMIIIALVVGLLVMLGSLWQLFIVGKYRGFLFSRLKRRQHVDQTSQNKDANPKQ